VCQPADASFQAVQLYCRSLTRVLLLLPPLLLLLLPQSSACGSKPWTICTCMCSYARKTTAVHHSVWHRSASSAAMCQPADSSLQALHLYCRSLTRVLLLLLLKSTVKRMWQQALDHLYLRCVLKRKK
jgi:hypothetical protein